MLQLMVIALATFNLAPTRGEQPVSHCGPKEVHDQQELYSSSSIVLLGGLFPLHKFTAHGRKNCEFEGAITTEGFQLVQAMVLAIQQVNRNDTILPGVKLAFDIQDTCTSSVTALEKSLRFLPGFSESSNSTNDKCFDRLKGVTASAVIGPGTSANSIPTQNLLRLFQIPQVSYAATASELSDKTRYNYFFRVLPPDRYQSLAMADLVAHFNWSYMAAINSDDVYGVDGISGFVDNFIKRNSSNSNNCISTEFTMSGNPTNEELQTVVSALRQPWVSNSSAIVFFGHNRQANAILNAYSNSTADLKHMVWVTSDSATTSILAENQPQAQGMLGIQLSFEANPDFDNWFRNLSLTNAAGSPWLESYWESVFNCTNGSTCSLESTFANDSTYSQDSKVTFTMEAIFAVANALHNMQENLCGGGPGMCPAMLESSGTRVIGTILQEYLQNVTLKFPYQSTDPLFDSNQDRLGGSYTVLNLQQKQKDTYMYEEVGFWKRDTSLTIHKDQNDIQFGPKGNGVPQSICSLPCSSGQYRKIVAKHPQSCCWECQNCGIGFVSDGITCTLCPETHRPMIGRAQCQELKYQYMQWINPWAIAAIVWSILGMCSTVAAAGFYIAFHKKQTIVASNRVMSAVILVGIFICYALPFVYIGKPHVVTCTLRRLAISICFSLCFGALLVKLSRIYRVVNRVTLGKSLKKPKFIDIKSQLAMVGIIVSIPLVAAVVWLVVEQPSVKINILRRWEAVEIRCGANPRIGLSLPIAYNLILLIVCVYFTIRTRKVPKEYNEARFIHLTVMTSAIVWLAFIAFYYSTAQLSEEFSIFATVSATLLTATLLLAFLIAHKIYSVFKKEKDDESYNNPTSALRRGANNTVTVDLACAKQSFQSSEVLEKSIGEEIPERTSTVQLRGGIQNVEDGSSLSVSSIRDHDNNVNTVIAAADLDGIQNKSDSASAPTDRRKTATSKASAKEISRIKSTLLTSTVATTSDESNGTSVNRSRPSI